MHSDSNVMFLYCINLFTSNAFYKYKITKRHVWSKAMKGLPGNPGSVPQSIRDKFKAAQTPKDKAIIVNAFVKKDAQCKDTVPLISSLVVRRWRVEDEEKEEDLVASKHYPWAIRLRGVKSEENEQDVLAWFCVYNLAEHIADCGDACRILFHEDGTHSNQAIVKMLNYRAAYKAHQVLRQHWDGDYEFCVIANLLEEKRDIDNVRNLSPTVDRRTFKWWAAAVVRSMCVGKVKHIRSEGGRLPTLRLIIRRPVRG